MVVVERIPIVGGGAAEVGGVVVLGLVELVAFSSTISAGGLDGGDGRASSRATCFVPEHAAAMTTMTVATIEGDIRR